MVNTRAGHISTACEEYHCSFLLSKVIGLQQGQLPVCYLQHILNAVYVVV